MSQSTCEDCVMTVEYLGPAEVASRIGVAPATVRGYASAGRMPTPDVKIGTTSGWSLETIIAWEQNRPGRGRWGTRSEGKKDD